MTWNWPSSLHFWSVYASIPSLDSFLTSPVLEHSDSLRSRGFRTSACHHGGRVSSLSQTVPSCHLLSLPLEALLSSWPMYIFYSFFFSIKGQWGLESFWVFKCTPKTFPPFFKHLCHCLAKHRILITNLFFLRTLNLPPIVFLQLRLLVAASHSFYLLIWGRVFVWDRICCSPGWPLTRYMTKNDLELLSLLPPPPLCWLLNWFVWCWGWYQSFLGATYPPPRSTTQITYFYKLWHFFSSFSHWAT